MSAVTPAVGPLAPGSEIVPGYEVLDHLSRARLFDVYDAWSREHMARTVVKVVREAIAPEYSVPRWVSAFQAFRVLTPPLYRWGVRQARRTGLKATQAKRGRS